MTSISDKSVDKMNTHFMFNNFFFRKSYSLLDNLEKYGRTVEAIDDNIIWRMCIARWIIKATNKHSEYEILIAFPRQY